MTHKASQILFLDEPLEARAIVSNRPNTTNGVNIDMSQEVRGVPRLLRLEFFTCVLYVIDLVFH